MRFFFTSFSIVSLLFLRPFKCIKIHLKHRKRKRRLKLKSYNMKAYKLDDERKVNVSKEKKN